MMMSRKKPAGIKADPVFAGPQFLVTDRLVWPAGGQSIIKLNNYQFGVMADPERDEVLCISTASGVRQQRNPEKEFTGFQGIP
ncbi:MAG: hypothetical protein PSX71_11240 [bacterium]|nr:hypothetical protein [bacterium]